MQELSENACNKSWILSTVLFFTNYDQFNVQKTLFKSEEINLLATSVL